jgi:hypothetical protein
LGGAFDRVKYFFYNSYGDLITHKNTTYPEEQLSRCDIDKDRKIAAEEFKVFTK